MDHFIQPVKHYQRRVDLIRDYVTDSARYLAQLSGDPLEDTRKFVIQSITHGKRALKIPTATFLRRASNGDREVQQLPFNQYLQSAMASGEIIAPTMTVYLPARLKKSLLATYISRNLIRRSTAKKAMFQAEIDALKNTYATLKSQQETFKLKNNALSGAQCSPFTPMWNKSGHSTLTSVCRTATSYANACNEKMLYGNRHYFSPDIVKANIISIINHSDLETMTKVMEQYQLKMPTVSDVMECIERGSHTYWRNREQMKLIERLITTLAPIERTAFLFTSDLYHLAQVNPDFVHGLLGRLAHKEVTPISVDEAFSAVKTMDDNMSAFVSIICATELRGKDIKSAKGRADANDAEGISDYGIVGATALHKYNALEHYSAFIRAFWVTDNLPSSIFALPSIIRRGVLTSDTDSTIFTTQQWVEWQHGKIDFSPEAIAIANSVVYIAGQMVRHILATLCGNMGVEQEEIFRLKMKNEYYFPVFALTSRAKHYYAYMAAQEGLVFKEMKSEIKGVALRSSAVSTEIIKLSHQTMFDLMDTVMRGDKISLVHVVRKVATVEREVLQMVAKGSFDYFKRDRVNPKDSYKRGADDHKFMQYGMWDEVFGPKYGLAPEPPYVATKASLFTNKRASCKEWIESIEDRALAERMADWMARNNKDTIGTIYMPTINLIAKGVPKEISQAVDVRSLIAQLMESFYLILEGLGVYARNKKITRLLSDDHSIRSLPEGVLIKQPPKTTTI